MSAKIIRQALDLVKPQFRLPIRSGEHGLKHWVRVWANAEMLCEVMNVDPTVPCWFAFMHDSQRFNQDCDDRHGYRAARWVEQLWHQCEIPITPGQLNQLTHALSRHSDGETDPPAKTIAICWDADRLDLGRVGIRPDPRRLCTEHARRPEVIRAAWLRSIS